MNNQDELDGLGKIIDDGVNIATYAKLKRATYGKATPPSKWHILYYIKWYFIIRPKVQKEINIALAKAVDEILTLDILINRIKD